MTPPRLVVIVELHPTTARLTVAPNGHPAGPSDIGVLCTTAGLLPRVMPRSVWIKRSDVPDFEAMCQSRNITTRTSRRRP